MSSAAVERGPVRALISAMRPVQWLKNILIGVAPAAAGVATRPDIVRHTGAAVLCFCALSSAVYLLNDVMDLEADRRHPDKRHRALAAGQLPPGVALGAAAVLALIAYLIPLALWQPEGLYLIMSLYLGIHVAYSLGLKHVAVIELGAVAAGFFLRAYAGAAADHIGVSSWFLVVIGFGALFVVVGKRSSELRHVGAGRARRVLADYSPEFLHSALTMSATVVVTTYCLWAFDTSSGGLSLARHHIVPVRLTVIPVAYAILYVMRAAEGPQGQSPEDLLARNHTVQILGAIWALLLWVGIYA